MWCSMIRFISFLILCSAIYLFYNFYSNYDVPTIILAGDYTITTNLFMAIVVAIICSSIVILLVKMAYTLLNAPYYIFDRYQKYKDSNKLADLIKAYSYGLFGNNNKAFEIVKKMKDHPPKGHDLSINVLLSVVAPSLEQRMYHNSYLLEQGKYAYHTSKILAKYFFSYANYEKSLEYAQKALSFHNDDVEIYIIVVESYAKLKMWMQFEESLRYFNGIKTDELEDIHEKVAGYYLEAAKHFLDKSNDDLAKQYLENALSYKADMHEAINMLCEINNSSRNNALNIPLLEDAFSLNPSYELFVLYSKSCKDMSNEEMYNVFTTLADPKEYIGVFLAIASYLSLHDKVQEIKDLSH